MAKKKIKDITFGEAKRFCEKHYHSSGCEGCPAALDIYCILEDWPKHMENELEVEE